MSINIVIPMAGMGSRFAKVGFLKPKPFIEVLGKSMIEHVIENVSIPGSNLILIARKEHLEREKYLVNFITNKYNAKFIGIDKLTEGTACTILYAKKMIDNNKPLLIANSDQIIDIKISDFVNDCIEKKLDGSIVTFFDVTKNPKWSFAKLDDQNLVSEVQEKQPISNNATVGIYFFREGIDFVDSAIQMLIENERVNNEFYTCPVYNYLIRENKKIGIYEINENLMHGLGTPEDLEIYIKLKKQ
jgi:dTDP-glucose pyrophosphorylase